MGEHRSNQVVKMLEVNPGLRISSQEARRIKKKAREKALADYFEDEKNRRAHGQKKVC